jgi:hypothetical protein
VSRAKGLWNLAKTATNKAVMNVTVASTNALHHMGDVQFEREFARDFATIKASGAMLLSSFICRVMHGGTPIEGSMFVTTSHLCFTNGSAVVDAFPWTTVAQVSQCVELPTTEGVQLFQLPDASVKPTAVQLYIKDKSLIEFVCISEGSAHQASTMGAADLRHAPAAGLCYMAIKQVWSA